MTVFTCNQATTIFPKLLSSHGILNTPVVPKPLRGHVKQRHHGWFLQHVEMHQDPDLLSYISIPNEHHKDKSPWDPGSTRTNVGCWWRSGRHIAPHGHPAPPLTYAQQPEMCPGISSPLSSLSHAWSVGAIMCPVCSCVICCLVLSIEKHHAAPCLAKNKNHIAVCPLARKRITLQFFSSFRATTLITFCSNVLRPLFDLVHEIYAHNHGGW